MTIKPTHLAAVLTECPHCDAELDVLRVISGKAGAEYWALQCTECGGIHLDIVHPWNAPHPASPGPAVA
jgi:uncharacterized Zn finger protein